MMAALVLACAALTSSSALDAKAPSCSPDAGLTFICGVQNPEDLVAVPGTRFLLASGMAPGAGLNLVDTRAKVVRPLYAP
jgi:hypothetical protein